MELKQFVKEVLTNLVSAVNEVNDGSTHKMYLSSHKETGQVVEFDIAVSAESDIEDKLGGGVKVLGFEIGSSDSAIYKNSTVSRVKFGVHVNSTPKSEGRSDGDVTVNYPNTAI
jgi:hypothetical protein